MLGLAPAVGRLGALCHELLEVTFSLKQLNQLLDHAAQHKDERDPLDLKHMLAAMGALVVLGPVDARVVGSIAVIVLSSRPFCVVQR